jgi:hypothetical protein
MRVFVSYYGCIRVDHLKRLPPKCHPNLVELVAAPDNGLPDEIVDVLPQVTAKVSTGVTMPSGLF